MKAKFKKGDVVLIDIKDPNTQGIYSGMKQENFTLDIITGFFFNCDESLILENSSFIWKENNLTLISPGEFETV